MNLNRNAVAVARWIINQPRKCLLDRPEKILLYVHDALETNRISVYFDPEEQQFKAVVFHWNDFVERIEHKAEQGLQQYEYGNRSTKGNAVFVAEAIGERKYIAKLYNAMFRKCPNFGCFPVFTFRHGKLVKIENDTLFRFAFGWKGVL